MKKCPSIEYSWNVKETIPAATEGSIYKAIQLSSQSTSLNSLKRTLAENYTTLTPSKVDTPLGLNNRPIIGILAQEINNHLWNAYSNQHSSYISASYVKFLESAGARVVPLWIGQDEVYYKNILKNINGVLFPGGAVYLKRTNGFADSARMIYRIATKMNLEGDYFPLWGTCLGFEVMTYIAAGDKEFRDNCVGVQNVALPLQFKTDFQQSRLFRNTPEEIIRILREENVTANFHKFCITEKGLAKVNLTSVYRVIAINHDANGLAYVSSIEHFDFPFYGVQFHPEKNNFEWAVRLEGIPHTSNAIKASQYFANFFIDEARKNYHVFPSMEDEMTSLIYNYPVTYSSPENSSFEQVYLFKANNTTRHLEDEKYFNTVFEMLENNTIRYE